MLALFFVGFEQDFYKMKFSPTPYVFVHLCFSSLVLFSRAYFKFYVIQRYSRADGADNPWLSSLGDPNSFGAYSLRPF